jgi:hypothetical protein
MRRAQNSLTDLEAFGLQKRDEEVDAERDGDGEAKERLEHAALPQMFLSALA